LNVSPIKLLSANDLTFAFEGDLSTDDIVLMMQAGKKPLFDGVNVKTAVKRD
jgi:hypothetical protein